MTITNEVNAHLKSHYSKSGNKAISRGKMRQTPENALAVLECLTYQQYLGKRLCGFFQLTPVRKETTPIHVKGISIRVLQTEVSYKPHTEIKYILKVPHIREVMPKILSG